MTVYLDVLLLSNLWVDYALLRTAAAVTHAPLRGMRGLLGALIGAAGSLTILLPDVSPAVCTAGRILLAFAMCAAAFGIRNIHVLLRAAAVLFLLSICFCGAVYALSVLLHPAGFYAHNTVLYADISLTVLLLGTAAASAVSVLIQHRSEMLPAGSICLHLRIGSRDLLLPALADTGCTLRDTYSGKPVAVCTGTALGGVIAADPAAALSDRKGFRLIPVSTVTGTRLLPAFQPELAAVRSGNSFEETPLDILIAVSDGPQPDTPAIVPAYCIHERGRFI